MKAKLGDKLEALMRQAWSMKSSDLHLAPHEPPIVRKDGVLARTEMPPLTPQETEDMARTIFGEQDLSKLGSTVGRLGRSFRLPDDISGQVSVTRSCGDYTLCARFNPASIPNTDDIKLPEAMRRALDASHGLILFTGGIGSGKQTAALSAVDYINSHRLCHICAIQHCLVPIESKMALVCQVEVGYDVPNSVAGIRAALGQDLDVLYLDEIRNFEELEVCIAAAQTGHLVISVMHAFSPEDALRRLIEVYPPDLRETGRRDVARYLVAISSQVLARKKTGGRAAAYGVLPPDAEMRKVIAEGRDIMKRDTPAPKGFQTIAGDIERLRSEGIISDEAAREALALL